MRVVMKEAKVMPLAAANGMTLASFMTTRKDSLHGDALALQRWAAGSAE